MQGDRREGAVSEGQAGSNDVNEKGFSQFSQTFSSAVWFVWETNRNLLLAPRQPRHGNMPQDYELYLGYLARLSQVTEALRFPY